MLQIKREDFENDKKCSINGFEITYRIVNVGGNGDSRYETCIIIDNRTVGILKYLYTEETTNLYIIVTVVNEYFKNLYKMISKREE